MKCRKHFGFSRKKQRDHKIMEDFGNVERAPGLESLPQRKRTKSDTNL